MKPRRHSETAQAYLEFLLVLFLFALLLVGITQLARLGSAQIRALESVRRLNWLRNCLNDQPWQDAQGAALTPEMEPLVTLGGDRVQGLAHELRCPVPVLGWLQKYFPNGLRIRARCAMIAYNPEPRSARELARAFSETLPGKKNEKP